MKAVVLKGNGEPRDVLALADIPNLAGPAAGQVIVRVNKRVIHAADYQTIRGHLPAAVFAPDGINGIDGVGIIEAVGAGVDQAAGIKIGARVILLSVRKTWAEYVVAPANHVITIPEDIDDEIACQLASNGATSVMLLKGAEQALGADHESPLLITAAASSVARTMIALSSLSGRRVIGLVRHDASASAARKDFEGLEIIGTDRPDWQTAVRAAAGHPIKVAIDPIGGEMMPTLLGSVADGGTLIVYGGLDPRFSSISSGMMTGRELTIRGMSAFAWPDRTPPEQKVADFERLFTVARKMPQIFGGYKVFPLADVADAIVNAEASPRRGATILTSDH